MDSNSPAGGGGGGGRRNRGRGKRNNNKRNNNTPGGAVKGGAGGASSSGNAGPKKTAVPPPPQVKLAFRHIGNPTAYGTTKAVLEDLLIPLLHACNAKSTAGTPSSATLTATSSVTPSTGFYLEIDTAAKRHLIDEEEAVLKYRKEWEEEQKNKTQASDSNKDEGAEQNPAEENKPEDPETKAPETITEPETLEVVAAPAPKAPPNLPVITVRPLYVVPPKKTRRRGDRPGVAYILLMAPKIEKVEIPETVPEDGIPAVVAHGADVESKTGSPQEDGSTPLPTEVVATDEVQPETQAEQSDTPDLVSETPAPASSAPTPPASVTSAPVKKSVDYSRQVAQGRVLLQNAIKTLEQVASSSSPTQEGVQGQQPGIGISISVETALSGKTWRWQRTRPDRRENTIESTADYKNWVASLEQQQADIKARPRPTPGGGLATALSEDGGAGGTVSGQPIAALVQHLRAKQQELKRKKSKKNRETPGPSGAGKDGKPKQGGAKGGKNSKKGKTSAAGEAVNKGSGAASAKKKIKKPRKKKIGSTNPKAVAPTTLVKPAGPTPS